MSAISKPRVPEGLRDMMKDLTKEILKEKPTDIYDFAENYFQSRLPEKENYVVKNFENSSGKYDFSYIQNPQRYQVPVALVYSIIPESLTNLIKDFIKAVLRQQPQNLCDFAVEYFRHLKSATTTDSQAVTKEINYSAYENYFINKERFLFTPYIKCTCGRTLGEAFASNYQFENFKSIHKLHSSDSTFQSKSINFDETNNNVNKLSKNDSSYSEKYINSIYIIQRSFRRYLKRKNVTTNNQQEKGMETVSHEAITPETPIVPQLQLNQNEVENNSEDVSYTSASTALLSATESGRETSELSTTDSILTKTVIESVEVDNDEKNISAENLKQIDDKQMDNESKIEDNKEKISENSIISNCSTQEIKTITKKQVQNQDFNKELSNLEKSPDKQISNDVESKTIQKDTKLNLEGQPKTISTIRNIEQVKDSDLKMFTENLENEGNGSDTLNKSSVVENNVYKEDANDVQNQSQDKVIHFIEDKSVINTKDKSEENELNKDGNENNVENNKVEIDSEVKKELDTDIKETETESHEDVPNDNLNDKSTKDVTDIQENQREDKMIHSIEDKSSVLENKANNEDIENQSYDMKLINEDTKDEINVKDTSETKERNKDVNENNKVEIEEKSVKSEIESELKKELHEVVQSDNLNDKSTKNLTKIQLPNISEDVKDEQRNINNETFDSKLEKVLDAEIIKDSNSQLTLNDESTNHSFLNTELKQSQNISENGETKINLDKVTIKDTYSQLNQEIFNDNDSNKIPIADSLCTEVKETQNIVDKENDSSSELIQDIDNEENKNAIITKSEFNELTMPLNAEIKELDNISEKVVDAENIEIFKNETNEIDIRDKSTEESIDQNLDKSTISNRFQKEIKGLENIPEEVVKEPELETQQENEMSKEKNETNSKISSNSTGKSLGDSQDDKTAIAEIKTLENSKIFKTETNDSIDEPPNKSDMEKNSCISVELTTSDVNTKIEEQKNISNKVEIENRKKAQNELNKLDMDSNNETNSEIVKNEMNETIVTDKERNDIKDKKLENKSKTLKDEEKFDELEYKSETVEDKEKCDKMETNLNKLKDEEQNDESESKSKTVNVEKKYEQSDYKSETEVVKNEVNESRVTDVDQNEIKDKESENKSITLKDEEKYDDLKYKSEAVKDEKMFDELKNNLENVEDEGICDQTGTNVDSNQVEDKVKCDESENKSEIIKDEKKFDESKNNSKTIKDIVKLSNEMEFNTKSSSDLIGADKETTEQENIPDNDEIEEIIVKNKMFNTELKNENTNKSNLGANNDKVELINDLSKTGSLKNENEKVEDISVKDENEDENEEESDKTELIKRELSETNNVINKSNLETNNETNHVNSEILDKTSKHNINIKDNTINESIENTLNTENKDREIIADNVDAKSVNQKNDTNASEIESDSNENKQGISQIELSKTNSDKDANQNENTSNNNADENTKESIKTINKLKSEEESSNDGESNNINTINNLSQQESFINKVNNIIQKESKDNNIESIEENLVETNTIDNLEKHPTTLSQENVDEEVKPDQFQILHSNKISEKSSEEEIIKSHKNNLLNKDKKDSIPDKGSVEIDQTEITKKLETNKEDNSTKTDDINLMKQSDQNFDDEIVTDKILNDEKNNMELSKSELNLNENGSNNLKDKVLTLKSNDEGEYITNDSFTNLENLQVSSKNEGESLEEIKSNQTILADKNTVESHQDLREKNNVIENDALSKSVTSISKLNNTVESPNNDFQPSENQDILDNTVPDNDQSTTKSTHLENQNIDHMESSDTEPKLKETTQNKPKNDTSDEKIMSDGVDLKQSESFAENLMQNISSSETNKNLIPDSIRDCPNISSENNLNLDNSFHKETSNVTEIHIEKENQKHQQEEKSIQSPVESNIIKAENIAKESNYKKTQNISEESHKESKQNEDDINQESKKFEELHHEAELSHDNDLHQEHFAKKDPNKRDIKSKNEIDEHRRESVEMEISKTATTKNTEDISNYSTNIEESSEDTNHIKDTHEGELEPNYSVTNVKNIEGINQTTPNNIEVSTGHEVNKQETKLSAENADGSKEDEHNKPIDVFNIEKVPTEEEINKQIAKSKDEAPKVDILPDANIIHDSSKLIDEDNQSKIKQESETNDTDNTNDPQTNLKAMDEETFKKKSSTEIDDHINLIKQSNQSDLSTDNKVKTDKLYEDEHNKIETSKSQLKETISNDSKDQVLTIKPDDKEKHTLNDRTIKNDNKELEKNLKTNSENISDSNKEIDSNQTNYIDGENTIKVHQDLSKENNALDTDVRLTSESDKNILTNELLNKNSNIPDIHDNNTLKILNVPDNEISATQNDSQKNSETKITDVVKDKKSVDDLNEIIENISATDINKLINENKQDETVFNEAEMKKLHIETNETSKEYIINISKNLENSPQIIGENKPDENVSVTTNSKLISDIKPVWASNNEVQANTKASNDPVIDNDNTSVTKSIDNKHDLNNKHLNSLITKNLDYSQTLKSSQTDESIQESKNNKYPINVNEKSTESLENHSTIDDIIKQSMTNDIQSNTGETNNEKVQDENTPVISNHEIDSSSTNSNKKILENVDTSITDEELIDKTFILKSKLSTDNEQGNENLIQSKIDSNENQNAIKKSAINAAKENENTNLISEHKQEVIATEDIINKSYVKGIQAEIDKIEIDLVSKPTESDINTDNKIPEDMDLYKQAKKKTIQRQFGVIEEPNESNDSEDVSSTENQNRAKREIQTNDEESTSVETEDHIVKTQVKISENKLQVEELNKSSIEEFKISDSKEEPNNEATPADDEQAQSFKNKNDELLDRNNQDNKSQNKADLSDDLSSQAKIEISKLATSNVGNKTKNYTKESEKSESKLVDKIIYSGDIVQSPKHSITTYNDKVDVGHEFNTEQSLLEENKTEQELQNNFKDKNIPTTSKEHVAIAKATKETEAIKDIPITNEIINIETEKNVEVNEGNQIVLNNEKYIKDNIEKMKPQENAFVSSNEIKNEVKIMDPVDIKQHDQQDHKESTDYRSKLKNNEHTEDSGSVQGDENKIGASIVQDQQNNVNVENNTNWKISSHSSLTVAPTSSKGDMEEHTTPEENTTNSDKCKVESDMGVASFHENIDNISTDHEIQLSSIDNTKLNKSKSIENILEIATEKDVTIKNLQLNDDQNVNDNKSINNILSTKEEQSDLKSNIENDVGVEKVQSSESFDTKSADVKTIINNENQSNSDGNNNRQRIDGKENAIISSETLTKQPNIPNYEIPKETKIKNTDDNSSHETELYNTQNHLDNENIKKEELSSSDEIIRVDLKTNIHKLQKPVDIDNESINKETQSELIHESRGTQVEADELNEQFVKETEVPDSSNYNQGTTQDISMTENKIIKDVGNNDDKTKVSIESKENSKDGINESLIKGSNQENTGQLANERKANNNHEQVYNGKETTHNIGIQTSETFIGNQNLNTGRIRHFNEGLLGSISGQRFAETHLRSFWKEYVMNNSKPLSQYDYKEYEPIETTNTIKSSQKHTTNQKNNTNLLGQDNKTDEQTNNDCIETEIFKETKIQSASSPKVNQDSSVTINNTNYSKDIERIPRYFYGVTDTKEGHNANNIKRKSYKEPTAFTIPINDTHKKHNAKTLASTTEHSLENSDTKETETLDERNNKLTKLNLAGCIDAEPLLDAESPTRLFQDLNQFEYEIHDVDLDITYTIDEIIRLKIENDSQNNSDENDENLNDVSEYSVTPEPMLQTIIELSESETPKPSDQIHSIDDDFLANLEKISDATNSSWTTGSKDDNSFISDEFLDDKLPSESIKEMHLISASDSQLTQGGIYEFANDGAVSEKALSQDDQLKEIAKAPTPPNNDPFYEDLKNSAAKTIQRAYHQYIQKKNIKPIKKSSNSQIENNETTNDDFQPSLEKQINTKESNKVNEISTSVSNQGYKNNGDENVNEATKLIKEYNKSVNLSHSNDEIENNEFKKIEVQSSLGKYDIEQVVKPNFENNEILNDDSKNAQSNKLEIQTTLEKEIITDESNRVNEIITSISNQGNMKNDDENEKFVGRDENTEKLSHAKLNSDNNEKIESNKLEVQTTLEKDIIPDESKKVNEIIKGISIQGDMNNDENEKIFERNENSSHSELNCDNNERIDKIESNKLEDQSSFDNNNVDIDNNERTEDDFNKIQSNKLEIQSSLEKVNAKKESNKENTEISDDDAYKFQTLNTKNENSDNISQSNNKTVQSKDLDNDKVISSIVNKGNTEHYEENKKHVQQLIKDNDDGNTKNNLDIDKIENLSNELHNTQSSELEELQNFIRKDTSNVLNQEDIKSYDENAENISKLIKEGTEKLPYSELNTDNDEILDANHKKNVIANEISNNTVISKTTLTNSESSDEKDSKSTSKEFILNVTQNFIKEEQENSGFPINESNKMQELKVTIAKNVEIIDNELNEHSLGEPRSNAIITENCNSETVTAERRTSVSLITTNGKEISKFNEQTADERNSKLNNNSNTNIQELDKIGTKDECIKSLEKSKGESLNTINIEETDIENKNENTLEDTTNINDKNINKEIKSVELKNLNNEQKNENYSENNNELLKSKKMLNVENSNNEITNNKDNSYGFQEPILENLNNKNDLSETKTNFEPTAPTEDEIKSELSSESIKTTQNLLDQAARKIQNAFKKFYKRKTISEHNTEQPKSNWYVGEEPIVANDSLKKTKSEISFEETEAYIKLTTNSSQNLVDSSSNLEMIDANNLSRTPTAPVSNRSKSSVDLREVESAMITKDTVSEIENAGTGISNLDSTSHYANILNKTNSSVDKHELASYSTLIDKFISSERHYSDVVNYHNTTTDSKIFSTPDLSEITKILSDISDVQMGKWDSEIPYEQLEKPCIKKSVSRYSITDVSKVPNTDTSSSSDIDDAEDSLSTKTVKLHKPEEAISKMQLRRDSTTKISNMEKHKEYSFDEPLVAPIDTLDTDEEGIVVNKLQREETRESSAQSDVDVIIGGGKNTEGSLKRVHTIAGVEDAKSLLKNVTIDESIKYIEPPEYELNSGSLCLDDDTAENIRRKMMAYSLSEADSDSANNTDPKIQKYDDFNVSTALVENGGSSTETESTIVSAVTKIQAGARGYLTRKHLGKTSIASDGKSLTHDDIKKASFGNAAISESLEHLVQEAAAKRIQRVYRQHYRQKIADAKDKSREQLSPEFATSMENTLAQKRSIMLQRGDALRNDSTPDEGSSSSNGSGSRGDNDKFKLNANKKSQTLSSNDGNNKIEKEESIKNDTSSSKAKTSAANRTNKIEENKMKWLAMRQNSMPVQIESEVLRVIPKYMRKKIKSAESEKKRHRRRLPMD